MFSAKKTETIEVNIHMLNGTVINGTLNPGPSVPTLENALNKASMFIEITTTEGLRRFFSKAQIMSVDPVEQVKEAAAAA